MSGRGPTYDDRGGDSNVLTSPGEVAKEVLERAVVKSDQIFSF